jgi:hypothetical protein
LLSVWGTEHHGRTNRISARSVFWKRLRAKAIRQQFVNIGLVELITIGVEHVDGDFGPELSDELSTDPTWTNGIGCICGNSYHFELTMAIDLIIVSKTNRLSLELYEWGELAVKLLASFVVS